MDFLGANIFFHLKELTLLVVIKFWGVGGSFVFSYSCSKSLVVSIYSLTVSLLFS